MPYNELTGQNDPAPVGPYTPGGYRPPQVPTVIAGPAQSSPLNATLGGVPVKNATDNPKMVDGKPVPGVWIRTLLFVDGTTKDYEYSVIDYPENASGDMHDWVPLGAKYLGEGSNDAQQARYDKDAALTELQKGRETQAQGQNSQQAGNMAAQTGNVMVPGPDGNPIPALDAQGQPIPTLAKEQLTQQATQHNETLAQQTAAQQAATGVQKEQNQITRERNAAQVLYENAQLEATKERDRINSLVALGTLNANAAKEKFDEWMKINVDVPFKQMEEARARATEARQAQQAEDIRRQNAAQFEQERNKTALGVGNEMVKATVATLPYMSGPNWGSQFGNALSAVAKGRPQDIHFDASGLNFQAPDFQKIAEDATARALAHLSPYAAAIAGAGNRPGGAYATTDYSQVPNIPSVAGAPTSQPMGGYTPGGATPVAPVVPPMDPNAGMPSEQWR